MALSVEGMSILLQSENPPPTRYEDWCKEERLAGKGKSIVLSSEAKNFINRAIEQVSPDCQLGTRVRKAKAHLYCSLESMDLAEAKRRLLALRNTMIRRWSRQPYLLSRRLALSLQLSDVLQRPPFQKGDNAFCSVLALAHPFEKPVSMMAPRWQKAVCDPASDSPEKAAKLGLDRSVLELEAMRMLYEKQSKAGLLRLDIPKSEELPKSFLVSLRPILADQSGAEPPLAAVESVSLAQAQRLCWSPIFGGDENLLSIARSLNLTGSNQNMDCLLSKPVGSSSPNLMQFLSDSLASETEFVITNGYSKVLQLPTGHYEYEIRPSWENDLEWEQSADILRNGVILWDGKQPRPVATIDKW